MTKHLKIVFIAAVLAMLIALVPAGAAPIARNGTVCEQGATIYLGEAGLNVTHALNQAYYGGTGTRVQNNSAPPLTVIGWWASAADLYATSPSRTIDIGNRYRSLTVWPGDFVGYTGNYYLLNDAGTRPIGATGAASMVFSVQDPALNLRIWDFSTETEVSGGSVPRGDKLGFVIETNLYPAVDSRFRSNVVDDSPPIGKPWPTTEYYAANNVRIDSTGSWVNGTRLIQVAPDPDPVYLMIYDMQYTNFSSSGPLMTWSRTAAGCYRRTSVPMHYNESHNVFVTSHSFNYPGGILTSPGFAGTSLCGQKFLNAKTDGYINISIRNPAGAALTSLWNQSAANITARPGPYPVLQNFVDRLPYVWGHPLNGQGIQTGNVWETGARSLASRPLYRAGTYSVSAESMLNGMKENYRMAGTEYTGKTVSESRTVLLTTKPSMAGVFRPANHTFYLMAGTRNITASFGQKADLPVTGDWNGDGKSEVGVFRPSNHTFFLQNGTKADALSFGQGTDKPVSGDWNGDGRWEVGVFRPENRTFYLMNGIKTISIPFGQSTDTPVTGDWNGDGKWDVGVFRNASRTFLLRNGTTTDKILYGIPSDLPVTGDWNGDGRWEVGTFRPGNAMFWLMNGTTNRTFRYGIRTDLPVAGTWT